MKKIAFTLAALTLVSAAFATQALASPRTTHSSYTSHGSVSHVRYENYHINYGTRFAHGYYYSGRQHNHWTFTRFDSRYGCNCYYDSGCSCWYYWCEPANCFYPVSYCPYRTYCWSTGGCSSGRIVVRPAVVGIQGPVGPVGPANVVGPVGPGGPVGPSGFNGPVGPGGPVGTGGNGPQGVVPTPNGPPPIPAPTMP